MADTVTIACNLPNGLIIRGFVMDKRMYPTPGGGFQEVMEARQTGQSFEVKGPGHEAGKAPNAPMSYSYALTHGCPKDLWDNWYTANKESDVVLNRCIFAHGQDASVQSFTKGNQETLSGLEAISLDTKGQIDDKRFKNMKIEKADAE